MILGTMDMEKTGRARESEIRKSGERTDRQVEESKRDGCVCVGGGLLEQKEDERERRSGRKSKE